MANIEIPNLEVSFGEVDVHTLTTLLNQMSVAIGEGVALAGLNTVGLARAVFIENGGTIPEGTPEYTIVVELAA